VLIIYFLNIFGEAIVSYIYCYHCSIKLTQRLIWAGPVTEYQNAVTHKYTYNAQLLGKRRESRQKVRMTSNQFQIS
jgi:hypothetical protein